MYYYYNQDQGRSTIAAMPTSSKKPRGRPRKNAKSSVTSDDPKTSKSQVARGRKRKAAAVARNNEEDEEATATSEKISPRRRTPRRSVSKANYKDSDSEDEAYVDEDDNESKVAEAKSSKSKTSTKKRKNPKRASARTKKAAKKDDDEYKDDDDDKQESGDEGGKPAASAKPSKRRKTQSNRSQVSNKETYQQLKQGAKCVTKYGVVEIISDDQLPADHHKSKITEKVLKEVRSIYRQNDRFNVRKNKLMDEFAIGTRQRRHELNKIYLDSISSNAANDDDKLTTQEKIWKQYCTTITPKQILVDGKSWKNPNKTAKEVVHDYLNTSDPRAAVDFHPDRIVKCKLVKDERKVVDVSGPKEGSTRLQYTERDPVEGNSVQLPIVLYLGRRELTRAYDPTETNYACSYCGVGNFKSREAVKYHIEQGLCTDAKLAIKKDSEDRIKANESKALSGSASTNDLLTKMHAVVSAKMQNIVSYKHIEEFGNPCKIKPSKRDSMPPWIVFNKKRSPLYPEMYITLGFRRGSQNRNFYNKQKLEEDYIPRGERRIERRKRKRFSLPGGSDNYRTSTHASRFSSVKIQGGQPNDLVVLPDSSVSLPSLPPMDGTQNSQVPPLPPVDVDFGSNNDNDLFDNDAINTAETQPRIVHIASRKNIQKNAPMNPYISVEDRQVSAPCPELGEGWIKRSTKRLNSSAMDHHYFSPEGMKFRSLNDARKYVGGLPNKGKVARGRRNPYLVKAMYHPPKPQDQIIGEVPPVIIDSQVLAAECEAGRYPTMNLFSGDHENECVLCQKPQKDDSSPLLECDFCKNSIHQVCLNKAMLRKEPPIVLREAEPHDSQMCHECLTVCVNRRSRAETRRMRKWQYELKKAGLGNIPEAVGLTEEVNLIDAGEDGIDSREVAQQEDDSPLYKPCPTGGPGGLICCSYCNSAYSRLLSNTTKEMEAQSIARKGQEVSEILELLADAKQRLRAAADLSHTNDQRRGLLKNNEA